MTAGDISESGNVARFPRGFELPTQSPLFWVEQKDRYLRQILIKDIESLTQRRFVVYFANRFEKGSGIEPRDTTHMMELLGDAVGQPIDLLLETNGGMTDAAESIISTIRSLTPDFRGVVANCAKSNGTLMVLAARSIVMGASSELGPIEPSIGDIPCSILDTPQVASTNFPLHMLGKHALRQSKQLASTLLKEGMMKGESESNISGAVEALSGRVKYPSHGSVVDHREAASLGLRIDYLSPGDPVWERIWLLYCMYDFDCRRSRFLKIFEGRGRSMAIAVPEIVT